MRFVTSENRPGRKALVPCRVVGTIVAAVLALMFWVGSAGAENKIFLECRGVTDNDMTAESIGDELASLIDADELDTYSFSSLVLSYHEGGQSTYSPDGSGTFVHYGLTVVRPVANSSPFFWKALATGESWGKCELYFTREDRGESPNKEYLRITIEDVKITEIEPRAVAQLKATGTGRSHLEAISFTFRKITWSRSNTSGRTFTFNLESGLPSK